MKRTLFGILFTCGVLPLLAGDLSGNWNWTTQIAGREMTLQLTLKQDGDALSGTVAGPRRKYTVKKGTVDGSDRIEIVLGGDGPLSGSKIEGRVDGDRLRLTVETSQGRSEEGIAVKIQ